MDVYNYSRDTFEFTSATPAIESPLEPGVWLIPACATDIAPPETRAHQVAVFEDNEWRLAADWRNTPLWSKKDCSPVSIEEIDIEPDDLDATDSEPKCEHCVWEGDHWEENEELKTRLLERYKAKMINWVDNEADEARSVLIGSPSQLAELDVIRQDAIAYNSKSYTDVVPRSVQIWSDVKKCTLDDADKEIQSISAKRLDIGYQIMQLRLAGKEAVGKATSKEQAKAAADKATQAIKAIKVIKA